MFDPSKKCPYFRKPCLKHDCAMYIALRGADPQTGHPVDEYGCAVVWNVVVTLEGNKETRQAGAAIESFRNEMVEQGRVALQLGVNEGGQFRRLDDARDDYRG